MSSSSTIAMRLTKGSRTCYAGHQHVGFIGGLPGATTSPPPAGRLSRRAERSAAANRARLDRRWRLSRRVQLWCGGLDLLRHRPDAVFIANYLMSISSSKRCSNTGCTVLRHRDASACNDAPVARRISPRLTTLDLREAGAGCRRLREMLSSGSPAGAPATRSVPLKTRSTCGSRCGCCRCLGRAHRSSGRGRTLTAASARARRAHQRCADRSNGCSGNQDSASSLATDQSTENQCDGGRHEKREHGGARRSKPAPRRIAETRFATQVPSAPSASNASATIATRCRSTRPSAPNGAVGRTATAGRARSPAAHHCTAAEAGEIDGGAGRRAPGCSSARRSSDRLPQQQHQIRESPSAPPVTPTARPVAIAARATAAPRRRRRLRRRLASRRSACRSAPTTRAVPRTKTSTTGKRRPRTPSAAARVRNSAANWPPHSRCRRTMQTEIGSAQKCDAVRRNRGEPLGDEQKQHAPDHSRNNNQQPNPRQLNNIKV